MKKYNSQSIVGANSIKRYDAMLMLMLAGRQEEQVNSVSMR